MIEKLRKLKKQLTWTYVPETEREASDAVVRNFVLHWFPSKVTSKSLSFLYTLELGTISILLFAILLITGVLLMFMYVPSVGQAYWGVKDIEYVVSFGPFIRGIHRIAASLMVAVVFLHMMRVFLTGAYKKGGKAIGSFRPLNWWIGLTLLLVTMLLSYTGYLLPWDQLAVWAVTIGMNIAKSAPFIGEKIAFLLRGGTIIDQNTLLRWYVAHVVLLPLFGVILIVWHMWRIRKDGGLGSVESLAEERIVKDKIVQKGKTYSLMGIVTGATPAIISHNVQGDTYFSSPQLTRRILIVFTISAVILLGIAFIYKAPLEAPASMIIPPNPAKAPWYFLWLQELVADTTIRIGSFTISGGFVGGILVPGVLILAAVLWPFLDKSGPEAIGVWFHKNRRLQNTVFILTVLVIIALIFVGSDMRGPYWKLYMPWQTWPKTPTKF
ncbi:MAG: cytochrome b N-terminal domain-containing protein [Deltaproteobacteria bacterium]|nr:cytochrome b N-terminal domain-containing protein [Deltaproteobacteria bacterium]MCL5792913.1 cytochrome b N-terminal domain-containing protein [Deltaproteobacteria bacterium]